jgi:hypothetical protein
MVDNKIIILVVVIVAIAVWYFTKSSFDGKLINTNLTDKQPLSFPPLNKGPLKLAKPDVPEEIGLAMPYPQGSGVGMEVSDSNSFYPTKPGPLLTDYVGPESYGESSLSDPTGNNGANQGSRILKIKNLGDQNKFKPLDETATHAFATAYTNGGSIDTSELHSGNKFRNGEDYVNYADNYVPSSNFNIQSSPGQVSTLDNCETTYPNTEKYEDYCITDGDIPYGKVVNGKVNPRLVDRWQSYTGIYDRDAALNGIDGLLYPVLNILK